MKLIDSSYFQNIVKVLGFVGDFRPFLVVLEFMLYGDLRSVIQVRCVFISLFALYSRLQDKRIVSKLIYFMDLSSNEFLLTLFNRRAMRSASG